MINPALFTSYDQKWRTPNKIKEQLYEEFGINCDPCPAEWNEFDPSGLDADWGESNFVNPPYKQISAWVKKCYQEWKKGKTVILLIPSRTDTRWWHEYIMKATEIRFIKGRLKFSEYKNSAPFPSAIVVFKGGIKNENKSCIERDCSFGSGSEQGKV